jgi:hypothetical protein
MLKYFVAGLCSTAIGGISLFLSVKTGLIEEIPNIPRLSVADNLVIIPVVFGGIALLTCGVACCLVPAARGVRNMRNYYANERLMERENAMELEHQHQAHFIDVERAEPQEDVPEEQPYFSDVVERTTPDLEKENKDNGNISPPSSEVASPTPIKLSGDKEHSQIEV